MIDKARIGLLAAAMAAMPATAWAQAPAPAGTPAPSTAAPNADRELRLARARTLVVLINPTQTFVEMNMRGWEAGIVQALGLNPTVISLEAKYPGIGAAAVDAARPIALGYAREFVAKAEAIKAEIFAETMSAAELAEAIAFYESPPGKRLIGRILMNMDPSALARDMASESAKTGQVASITSSQVARVEHQATQDALSATSAEDHVALLRFQQRPASTKMTAAAAESDRLILDMAQAPNPEWIRKQTEVINATILNYVDARSTS